MTANEPELPESRAPLGSWSLLYILCCVLAVLVMVLLYWFTARFNLRLEN